MQEQRLRPRKNSSASASAPIEWILFFDFLPQELLENILKFLSRLPDGTMGAFLKSQFHTLCISRTINCRDECQLYKWNVPTENMLWTDDINIAHDFVLRAGGEFLHTIIIGKKMYCRGRDRTEMVGDFLRACPNVRSLSVSRLGTYRKKFGTLDALWSYGF